jgi:hypothetical protein
MSTYLEIDGDPNQVGASGAAVRAVSESFTARSRAIAANIRAIEAERPWGDDKYGQAFETTYSFVPDGGRSPLREEIPRRGPARRRRDRPDDRGLSGRDGRQDCPSAIGSWMLWALVDVTSASG